jgi:hypothetical protein
MENFFLGTGFIPPVAGGGVGGVLAGGTGVDAAGVGKPLGEAEVSGRTGVALIIQKYRGYSPSLNNTNYRHLASIGSFINCTQYVYQTYAVLEFFF